MVKVNGIIEPKKVEEMLISIERKDFRALTHLRTLLDNHDLAANPIIRSGVRLYMSRCICKGTLYLLMGLAFQYGGCINDKTLCCLQSCKQDMKVASNLRMLYNMRNSCGLYQQDACSRNWAAIMLNRHDPWEGGVGAIPSVFMPDLESNLFKSVAIGSEVYYQTVVDYARKVCNEAYQRVLCHIVNTAVSVMDMVPITYAIRECPKMKEYTLNLIQTIEPVDTCARQGLINITNQLETIEI